MAAKHCTTEKLLAYLDVELSSSEYRTVKEHLAACWRCRAKAEELESSVLRLAREFSAPGGFPDKSQTAEAKRGFLAWRQSEDAKAAAKFGLLCWRFPRAIAASLALSSMALSGLAIWIKWQPAPSGVLSRAQANEQLIVGQAAAIHEVYRLEVRETTPARRSTQGHLEIWSEPNAKRFAWRWKDEAHQLRFAEWHPAAEKNYFFDQSSPALDSQVTAGETGQSLADLGEPGTPMEQLNLALVGWIRSQRWRVLSIARDFASFANRDGIALSMSRVRSANGASRFILEARQADNEKQLTLALDVDEKTGRALGETATMSNARGTVELRVIADQVQSLRTAPVSLDVFRPEVEITRSTPPMPRIPGPKRAPRMRTFVLIDPRLLDDAEVQVYYALHRTGLCLGAPIAVSQDKSENVIRISGVVDGEPEKEEIHAAVSELPAASLVRIEVKTLGEATPDTEPAISAKLPEDAPANVPSVVGIETLIVQSSLSDVDKAKLKSRVAGISNELISTSETMTQEAWALRRLTARFSARQVQMLGMESRNLIALMTGDHLLALDRTSAALESAIAPFRFLLQSERAAIGQSISANGDSQDGGGLVEAAELINRQSQLLFALGHPAQAPARESAARLCQALPDFKARLAEARRRSAQLLIGPMPQSEELFKSTREFDK